MLKKNRVVPALPCHLGTIPTTSGNVSTPNEGSSLSYVGRIKVCTLVLVSVLVAEASVLGIAILSKRSCAGPWVESAGVYVIGVGILLAVSIAAICYQCLPILQLRSCHGVQMSGLDAARQHPRSHHMDPQPVHEICIQKSNRSAKFPQPGTAVDDKHVAHTIDALTSKRKVQVFSSNPALNIYTRIQDVQRCLIEHALGSTNDEEHEPPDALVVALDAVNDVVNALQDTKNLLAPNFGFVDGLDEETERWLMHEVCASSVYDTQVAANDRDFFKSVTQRVKRAISFSKLPKLMGDKELHGSNLNVLKSMLDSSNKFQFDVFNFSRYADERPICVLGFYLFKHYDLIKLFDIDTDRLINLLNRVEDEHCPQNPYHNSKHGTDMLQTMHYFLTGENLRSRVSPVEIMAALLACMFRNIAHPGVDNQYLVSSKARLALVYNNRSCVENHSCSRGISILLDDSCNILSKANPTQQAAVNEIVIELVLSMDYKHHFQQVCDLKTRFFVDSGNISNCFSVSNPQDRLSMLTMALKCADIAYTIKSTSEHLQWVRLIRDEQCKQGDQEKRENLPVSPFMGRNDNFAKAQSNFIEFVALPLMELWSVYLENPKLLHQLKENLVHWTTRSNTEESEQDAKWRCGHGTKNDGEWDQSSDEENQGYR